MTIILDAMGSDLCPDPEIEAAVLASDQYGIDVMLSGNESILEPKLKKFSAASKVKILHAPDSINMHDKATESAKDKPLNSIAVGLQAVKNEKAEAFVTAGNTGAAYFHAVSILKRIEGISRPALTTCIPTLRGKSVFLDTGANADCRPEFLLDFALLGSLYADKVMDKKQPKVAILSNGEEEGKGNQLVKEAYPLLKTSSLNFIGNIESKEIFAGLADVIIADGFTGNVFIKTSEAVAKMITTLLKQEISASFTRKLGYLLAKPAFSYIKQVLDPAEIGAAMLMGVNGYVFIGHGRSDAKALINSIKLADRSVKANLLTSIREALTLRNSNKDQQ